MNTIDIRDIIHCFGKKMVLNRITFQVKKGEIFGLLGPSGAGKTTLINILTGQIKATNGECTILGIPAIDFTGDDYKQIGVMMDHFGLYERMSCYDNLRFYQMLNGGEKDDIEEVLRKVGLFEAKKTLAMNLSKGMKNRLSFARAILRKPKILFLDEPTSGLDPVTTKAIHEMIYLEKEKGTTIFLTTHNMHEAEKLCDTIALLNDGKVVEMGSPIELCRKYNCQGKICIHLKNGQDVVLDHKKESGDQIKYYFDNNKIETIHSTEPNLEKIFMDLTGRKLDV